MPVKIYFVADTPHGLKLFSEERSQSSFDDMNLQVISDLVSGKVAPLDPDYTNLWGGSNTVNTVTVNGSIATVDLNVISLNVGAELTAPITVSGQACPFEANVVQKLLRDGKVFTVE